MRMPLPRDVVLEDGSYHSRLYAVADRHRHQAPMVVRVVECQLDDLGRPGQTEGYRLLTNVLDPAAAPAPELAAVYGERWEIETVLDELKTHQRGPSVVLRSKQPSGVEQEVHGYLCVHHALRRLMHVPLCRRRWHLSASPSSEVCRQPVGAHAPPQVFPPEALTAVYAAAGEEILAEPLPKGRLRAAPRVVKHKMSNFKLRPSELASAYASSN